MGLGRVSAPVPPPPAFVGHLLDLGIDWHRREIEVRLRMPLHHLDGVQKVIGHPPGPDGRRRGPGIVILPGEFVGDERMIAEAVNAALTLLEQAAIEGLVGQTQALVERVGDLAELYGAVEPRETLS
ncbi:MAG: hypothetical protein COT28_03570 [Methylobacterium sp. CG08_land_8_20_14_0_20_71_15]|nr:MAG: hypothetical protein COT56_02320 [Methylobacterium sp. CG09_land_8_20_14_0_10_71_15]PIU15688.1 MAG: hypothetical protein COT28_03570 [Methylobacterium sp. CG08_land_8_20_14_0_20_71_15]GBU17254.1 hypothetical protein AwMethylo_14690 [Methylobacterium sp.]